MAAVKAAATDTGPVYYRALRILRCLHKCLHKSRHTLTCPEPPEEVALLVKQFSATVQPRTSELLHEAALSVFGETAKAQVVNDDNQRLSLNALIAHAARSHDASSLGQRFIIVSACATDMGMANRMNGTYDYYLEKFGTMGPNGPPPHLCRLARNNFAAYAAAHGYGIRFFSDGDGLGWNPGTTYKWC